MVDETDHTSLLHNGGTPHARGVLSDVADQVHGCA